MVLSAADGMDCYRRNHLSVLYSPAASPRCFGHRRSSRWLCRAVYAGWSQDHQHRRSWRRRTDVQSARTTYQDILLPNLPEPTGYRRGFGIAALRGAATGSPAGNRPYPDSTVGDRTSPPPPASGPRPSRSGLTSCCTVAASPPSTAGRLNDGTSGMGKMCRASANGIHRSAQDIITTEQSSSHRREPPPLSSTADPQRSH